MRETNGPQTWVPMIIVRPSIEDPSLGGSLIAGRASGMAGLRRVDSTSTHPAHLEFILRFLYLIDVVGSPPRFRFRLAGTGIVKEYGAEITSKLADEIDLNEHQTAFVAE
jgi:hypothetical protein